MRCGWVLTTLVERSEIFGTWELATFEISFSDGRASIYPFGAQASGLLIYDPLGYMSATLVNSHREALGVGRIEKAADSEMSKKAAAFDTYLSYAGRWTLVDDVVTHRVFHSLVPDLVGAEQVRRVSLVDGELELGYEITARSGVERRYRLRWRRPDA